MKFSEFLFKLLGEIKSEQAVSLEESASMIFMLNGTARCYSINDFIGE